MEQWTDDELYAERRRLADSLPGLADFTPASLHEEWRRCGKPTCRCARKGDPGHGPRYTLVRRRMGRVVTRRVPAVMVAEFEERTKRWAQFQQACSRLAEVNAELDRRRLLGEAGAGRSATGAERQGGATRVTRSARPV
ncbi:hypothetical protein GCM10009785_31140 [Brooklawnia cerclae]|uniref:DUF6788 domain-containing protein n=1 Tax=Brooklawnia cerclae TaxID=349934 RepID=A0ABX0SF44_9ACTN|nr:DUF6788 family protein [Brooklawnia cerclae]NIH56596.1 hypothetical protein [Brooklawnia cerclae]